jgi:hypothetical protein
MVVSREVTVGSFKLCGGIGPGRRVVVVVIVVVVVVVVVVVLLLLLLLCGAM